MIEVISIIFIILCVVELVLCKGKLTKMVLFISILTGICCLVFVGPYLRMKIKEDVKETRITFDKPIIYLYPENETEISVKVTYENKLTHTYPKYTSNGWRVLAKPNGDLTDLYTGRYLYSLYYESKNIYKLDTETGFVVKGEDTIPFLEDKLALLGLNEREAQEFIIYWLPKMENNKYNFVYFLTNEELDKEMPLEVIPEPDTSIRILMQLKALDKPIDVKEQVITTPERKGFTLVEWGGTEYER